MSNEPADLLDEDDHPFQRSPYSSDQFRYMTESLNEKQKHLMDLLADVKLGDSESPDLVQSDAGAVCPGCGSTDSWGASSWCPSCGYFPKTGKSVFGDNVRESLEQIDSQALAGLDEEGEESSASAIMFIVLGVLVFAGLGVGAIFLMPGLNPFQAGGSEAVSTESAAEDIAAAQPENDIDEEDSAAANVESEEQTATVPDEVADPSIIKTSEAIVADLSAQGNYLIFGYATNQAGEIRSIMLAANHPESENHYYFAGKLSLSTRDGEFLTHLQELLDQYRASRPALQTPYEARWVAPVVTCQVHHNGATPDGRIADGQLVSFKVPEIE